MGDSSWNLPVSAILGLKLKTLCRNFLNLAHYFPYDVKLRLVAHSRVFLANQKARNAIVGAENLLNIYTGNSRYAGPSVSNLTLKTVYWCKIKGSHLNSLKSIKPMQKQQQITCQTICCCVLTRVVACLLSQSNTTITKVHMAITAYKSTRKAIHII